MPLKIEHGTDRITRRAGMVLVNEFGERVRLATEIDRVFGPPGSNRGRPASAYITTLVEMAIDGALTLEHVAALATDEAYKELAKHKDYPSAEAIGDWLRRHGGVEGEQKMWKVQSKLLALSRGSDMTLDIDATFIEADKGDGRMSYKGEVGYFPMLGVLAETGIVVGSEFRFGNASPQEGLKEFVIACRKVVPKRIARVRSDSAGYRADLINHLTEEHLEYTISADHDEAVMAQIATIPETAWIKAFDDKGTERGWEAAETVHTMNATPESFRLVVKRTPRAQLDAFEGSWKYWVIATNIPRTKLDTIPLINFHAGRGEMERIIGELKAHFGCDHMPCGQFSANSLYFATRLLAYNIVQLMKQIAIGPEQMKRSIRTVRYELMHLAARLVHHAGYTVLRVVAPLAFVQQFISAYHILHGAPFPAPA